MYIIARPSVAEQGTWACLMYRSSMPSSSFRGSLVLASWTPSTGPDRTKLKSIYLGCLVKQPIHRPKCPKLITNRFSVENETRCYDELGCLNITRSWYHLIHRPFNIFPLPRSVINTGFILYTRFNPIEVLIGVGIY